MIAFIKGTIHLIRNDYVIVDCNGVGYRIYVANLVNYQMNKEVLIYTYQHIREDANILFGFDSIDEYDLFLKLISVKGVGPKSALAMLSVASSNAIIEAIDQNDVKMLKSLPGIGAKTASQIVLDLRGKLIPPTNVEVKEEKNEALEEAFEALKSLGYKNNELMSIKKELLETKEATSNVYIRKALVLLAMKKGV